MAAPLITDSLISTWHRHTKFVLWSQENPNFTTSYAETIYEKYEALTFKKDEAGEEEGIELIHVWIKHAFIPFQKLEIGTEEEPEYTDKTDLFHLWFFLWFINREWNMKRIQDSVRDRIAFGIKGFQVRYNKRGSGNPRPLFSFGGIPLGARPYWVLRPDTLGQLANLAAKYEYPCPDLRKSWKGCP
jgi:hypothetical protein